MGEGIPSPEIELKEVGFMRRIRWASAFLIVVFLFHGSAQVTASPLAYAQQEEKQDKKKEKKKDKNKKEESPEEEWENMKKIRAQIQPAVDEQVRAILNRYYGDEFLQDYVNEVGQSLVPPDAPSDTLFSFRVIMDPTPNAFAFPDGRIFVHSGLLTFVDNEAQLAYILGHEIGHVLKQHTPKMILRAQRGASISEIIGDVLVNIFRAKGKEAAADATELFRALYTTISINSFSRDLEDEADLIGMRLAFKRKFDCSQAVGFFQKLTAAFGDQDRLSNLLWGNHSRNVDRIRNVRKLLDGELSGEYNQLKSAGELTAGSGRFRLRASRLFRDTAILQMEVLDRYDLAKKTLESIQDVRARDPVTLWYLGRVYKLTARTEEQKNQALELLQRAAQLDERNLFPEIHFDLGLMLAERTAETNAPAAVESLKKYVQGYVKRYGRYPPDLYDIYDYLLLFGDSKWTAPELPGQFVEPRPKPVQAAEATPGKETKSAEQQKQEGPQSRRRPKP
jgi:predicted Zn-dependent protease